MRVWLVDGESTAPALSKSRSRSSVTSACSPPLRLIPPLGDGDELRIIRQPATHPSPGAGEGSESQRIRAEILCPARVL